MILPIIVGVSFALVLWQAVRKPVLRRLALRAAVRRPAETLLVIAGSLLGTALITGSFIVGDTLDSSIKATAFTQLGPIDELVSVPDRTTAESIERKIAALDDDRIDGVMTLVGVQSPVAAGELAEPEAQLLELDFEQASSFGKDPAATGITGETPPPGSVAITEDLARALELSEGDEATVYIYGKELELNVDRVLPRLGLAGFWTGFESISRNAFVAPGTIEEAMGGEPPEGAVPPLSSILISNRGGVEAGAALTDEVTSLVEGVLEEEAGALRVEDVKQRRLNNAEAQGDQFGELFLAIGSFAIVAGVLLLVNIFVMLAEERKGQLGMLRAVGMRRSHLVRAFMIEGAIYAFLAGALGAVLGIGVGWAIATLAAPIFGGFDDFSLELRFAIDPASLVVGFCVGVLISLFTVLLTSLRISRINIIRAVRDLPEPPKLKSSLRAVIGGSLLTLVFGSWFATSLGNDDAWLGALVGLPLALFASLPLLGRLIGRRTSVIVVSAASLLWGIFSQVDAGGEIFAFVAQGILLTFTAVVLLTQIQETLGSFMRRIAARNLPLRLSIAYPLARRFRTGLTLGMFALVIFTMTFISVLSNVFGGQVDTATAKEGGFDILATASSTNPPTVDGIRSVEGVKEVASLLSGVPLFTAPSVGQPKPWSASGIDEVFVEGGPPVLGEKPPGLTADEVWAKVVADPSVAVVPSFFLQDGGGPPAAIIEIGEQVTALDPLTGERFERTVIGHVENDTAFSGMYVNKESLREILGDRAAASRFYIETGGSPVHARDVALRLQGEFVGAGVEAKSFRSLVEEMSSANLQFFQLMQSYLALGLLVGIAGLGVVMVRAVRERRREVGVLRSLGFVPGQVRTAFLLESGFVALEGILVGAALALVTASQLIATGEFGQDLSLQVPWGQLALLTGAALAASLLATAWPAQDASRTAPAVALRSV